MISFASLISAASVHNNQVGRDKSAAIIARSSPQQNFGLHIQRKASCACEGGCPRCVQKSEAVGPGARVASPATIYETAVAGVHGQGALLPHLDRIQASFGRYDVTTVRGHVDGAASQAAREINASAYALDGHVAFDGHPDVFTAAHEAAHIVQQRAGVQLKGGIGAIGDRFERHADAVAGEVVAGRSAEHLLDQHAPDKRQPKSSPVVQREEVKKVGAGIKDAAVAAEVTATINIGLAQVDEELIKGTKNIRLAIRNDAEFERAWDDYCDRSGTPGAAMGDINGFVDPTHPNGKTGFVKSSKGIGTAIHEAMHQRANAGFYPGKAGQNVNEGTTELFTRVVIAYAGSKIERNVYEDQKTAMLRLQGICGLKALAQWYFKGDISAVEKSLGSKLERFMYWMDSRELDSDVASRAKSAIDVL